MKILVQTVLYRPEVVGTAVYTTAMCEWLVGRGHTVHVVCTPPYYPLWKVQAPYRASQYMTETLGGVTVSRCPVWMPKKPQGLGRVLYALSFTLSSLPRMFAGLRFRPDVVFVTSPSFLNAVPTLAVARSAGASAWLHVQDFELDIALGLEQFRWHRLRAIVSDIESRLLQAFDVVSTISQSMLQHLRDKGVNDRHRVFFPNWVDTGKIFPMGEHANEIRAELRIHPEQIVCLFSGSLGAKQGVEFLVEAARRLEKSHPAIVFIIGGAGPTLPDLHAAAKGLSNLHFLPLQPPERLNVLLNAADIHVLTQRPGVADLVMPSKLLGMLASGKPVIATVAQDSEVSRCMSAGGVVVEPGDAAALAQAIADLASDKERRETLGQEARAIALDQFGAEAVLTRFEQTLLLLARK